MYLYIILLSVSCCFALSCNWHGKAYCPGTVFSGDPSVQCSNGNWEIYHYANPHIPKYPLQPCMLFNTEYPDDTGFHIKVFFEKYYFFRNAIGEYDLVCNNGTWVTENQSDELRQILSNKTEHLLSVTKYSEKSCIWYCTKYKHGVEFQNNLWIDNHYWEPISMLCRNGTWVPQENNSFVPPEWIAPEEQYDGPYGYPFPV